jgi:hypothetical protein
MARPWCVYCLETAVSVAQPFLHGANTPQYTGARARSLSIVLFIIRDVNFYTPVLLKVKD